MTTTVLNLSQVLAHSFLNPSIETPSATSPPMPTSLDCGQAVTFTVTFPPPLTSVDTINNLSVLTTLVIPLFSASVTWEVLRLITDKNHNEVEQAMEEGKDYLVLSGNGLNGNVLTLVFSPPSYATSSPPSPATEVTEIVVIRAKAVATAIDTTTGKPVTEEKEFDPLHYNLSEFTPATLDTPIKQLLDMMYVGVPDLIVNPGDVVTAQVALRKLPGQAQSVKSIAHEAPSVEIRGSIPLDNVLNFILEPFRKLNSFIPSTNPLSKTDHVAAHVKKLLPSALSVPVRLDIRGQRLTNVYEPIGGLLPVSFSRTPDESGDLQGFLSLGQWPLPFSIPNQPAVTKTSPVSTQPGIDWKVEYTGVDNYLELNTAFGMFKSLLLFPEITTLGTSAEPRTATITATPYIEIGGTVLDAPLPHVELKVTPLPLPEVIVLIEHPVNTGNVALEPGRINIYVSYETGAYAGSVDEFIQLIGNLGAVINDLISVISTIGDPFNNTRIPQSRNLTYLNKAIRLMSTLIAKSYEKQLVGYVIANEDNKVSIPTGSMGNGVSAFIAIAPRPMRLEGLYVTNVGVAKGYLYIAPTIENSSAPYYSSYIPSLNHVFNSEEMVVIPPGSTIAIPANHDYNDHIVGVEFNS